MAGNPPSGGGLNPQLKKLLDNISERVDVLSDNRGDPLDRALTPRDLIDLGLAKRLGKVAQRLVSGGNLISTTGPGSSAIPPRPTGFVVTGGLSHIFLEWDNVRDAYSNHGYTAIFRHSVDNLANAIEVAQTTSSFNFGDLDVHFGTDYYYWIRFVSTSNIMGPPNSSSGTLGKVAEDPAELLARLSNQIASTHLAESLRTRIDLIDNPATGLIDRAIAEAERLTAEISTRSTAISNLATQLGNEAAARAQDIADFDSRLEPAELEIIAQDERITSLEVTTGDGGAIASAIEVLDTRVGTIDGTLVAQATKNTQLDTAIAGKVSSSAFDGLQSTVTELGETLTSESERLTNLESAVGDSASSGAVSALNTRVTATEESIAASADDITNLRSRLDDSGTGLGAISTALANLNTSVGLADGKATTAGSNIVTINQRLDNSDTGLGAVNSQLSTIGGRMEAAEGFIELHGYSIDSLEQTIEDPLTGVSALNTALDGMTTDITNVDGRITIEANKILTINQRLDHGSTGLTALNSAKDGILSQINDSATGLSAQNSKITTLESQVNDPSTGLSATSTALQTVTTAVNHSTTGLSAQGTAISSIKSRIDNIGGSASSIESIATTVNHGASGVAASASKIGLINARLEYLGADSESIESIANTVTDADDGVVATSVKFDQIKSRIDSIGGSATSIESLTTAVNDTSTGVSATATKASQLEARLNNVGGITMEQSFSAQADSITGLYGEYTLKIDVNGRVSGYGLASTSTASTFIINADQFAIGKPGATTDDIYPFIVDTTTGYVVMNGAFIKNATINDAQIGAVDVGKITGLNASFIIANIGTATIDTARIQDAAITSAKIVSAAITTAKIADASITTAKIASVIQSDNYSAGSDGWQIKRNGDAEFNGIVISRPNVVASGTFYPTANWAFVKSSGVWVRQGTAYAFNPEVGYFESTTVKEFATTENEGITFRIDTAYDNLDDIYDTQSASFAGKAIVYDVYFTYSSSFSGAAFYASAECSVGLMLTYSGVSSTPPVLTNRVILYVTIRLPKDIHSNILTIRIDSIKWALHRIT